MKYAVEFPSVSYRDGPESVLRLAKAVEDLGFDQLDMFDHVVMGYATDSRPAPRYPPQMPIMEALMMLSFVAAGTRRIGLGTEVLVLPQRNPTLVAKQVATLAILSGGRVRLGVGVGWQQSEFEALGEDFHTRGRRCDEAIDLLRAYWRDDVVSAGPPEYQHYEFDSIAMEPKPPLIPIWLGGTADAALRRCGEKGDGWLGTAAADIQQATRIRDRIRDYASEAGRDPDMLGFQMMLASPPEKNSDKGFFADDAQVQSAAVAIAEAGFDWMTLNMTAMFQAGARTETDMIDSLEALITLLRREIG